MYLEGFKQFLLRSQFQSAWFAMLPVTGKQGLKGPLEVTYSKLVRARLISKSNQVAQGFVQLNFRSLERMEIKQPPPAPLLIPNSHNNFSTLYLTGITTVLTCRHWFTIFHCASKESRLFSSPGSTYFLDTIYTSLPTTLNPPVLWHSRCI